jgi:hypothetical protein
MHTGQSLNGVNMHTGQPICVMALALTAPAPCPARRYAMARTRAAGGVLGRAITQPAHPAQPPTTAAYYCRRLSLPRYQPRHSSCTLYSSCGTVSCMHDRFELQCNVNIRHRVHGAMHSDAYTPFCEECCPWRGRMQHALSPRSQRDCRGEPRTC